MLCHRFDGNAFWGYTAVGSARITRPAEDGRPGAIYGSENTPVERRQLVDADTKPQENRNQCGGEDGGRSGTPHVNNGA